MCNNYSLVQYTGINSLVFVFHFCNMLTINGFSKLTVISVLVSFLNNSARVYGFGQTVKLGCSENCTWSWMTSDGKVSEECTRTWFNQFICQDIQVEDCTKGVDTCYAKPFTNVNYTWQEDKENRAFKLHLGVEVLREDYQWRLNGLVIKVFGHGSNEGECHHINFARPLRHDAFQSEKIIFEYGCFVNDFQPGNLYYLEVAASPMPTPDLNIEQWSDYSTVPRPIITDLVTCEKSGDAVRWEAEYINIITWYGGFQVEFSVAPEACGFEKYFLFLNKINGINNSYVATKIVRQNDAGEKFINGNVTKVISTNFTDYVGKYQVKISGHYKELYGIGYVGLVYLSDSPCSTDPCVNGECVPVYYTQEYSCNCDENYVERSGTCLDIEDPTFSGCKVLQPTLNYNVALDEELCEVFWESPVASDNVGVANVTSTHIPGDLFHLGIHQVVYTAVDVNGNEAKCSFYVNVEDSPCSTDPCVNGECVPVYYTKEYSCNCDENYVERSGTCLDIEAPTFSGCKVLQPTLNYNVALDEERCEVFWESPVASDNVGVANVTSTHIPGDLFHLGIHQVVYTAVDVNGNEAKCSFYVSVDVVKSYKIVAVISGIGVGIVFLLIICCLHHRFKLRKPSIRNKHEYEKVIRYISKVPEEKIHVDVVKLIIIYFEDATEHKNVVLSLATFLQVHCGIDVTVHDWKTPDIVSLTTWLSNEMKEAKKVLFISSYGASVMWNAYVRKEQCPIKYSPYRDIFILALEHMIGEKLDLSLDMQSKYLVSLFDYSDMKCIPDPLKHLVVFQLPSDLSILFFRLHDLAKDDGDGSWLEDDMRAKLETPEGQTLLKAVDEMKMLIETNEKWFSEKLDSVAVERKRGQDRYFPGKVVEKENGKKRSGNTYFSEEVNEMEYELNQVEALSLFSCNFTSKQDNSLLTETSGFNSMETSSFCNPDSMGV